MGISSKVAGRLRGMLREQANEDSTSTLVDSGPDGSLGPYQLEEVIGVGGMGTVYRAVDRETGQAVALKVPHRGAFPFSGRFERESEFAHVLGQVGDAPYLDHGVTSSGTPFLAMPLLDGETLDERLNREGRLAPGEVLRIAERVAHVLGEMHRRGLVHRDVKPGNVLVDDSGAVWLVDHGLTGGPETLKGAGTPTHAAPEQLAGFTLSPAADVFALGVLTIEMWLGEPVFESAAARLRGVSDKTLQQKLARCEHAALRALLGTMVAEQSAARPPTGDHAARAFARLHATGAFAASRLGWRARGLLGPVPFVGRTDELAAVAAAIDTDGEARVVGPPGIGKSRLIAEWCRRHAPPEATIAWPEPSISPHPTQALEAARGWAEAAAGLCGGESASQRRVALRELAAAIDDRAIARLESRRADERALAFTTILGASADEGGLVLVTEHGKALDRDSARLLAELRRRHGRKVLCLHEVPSGSGAVRVPPLTDEELSQLDPPDTLPDAFERARARAAGNPLAFQAFVLGEGDTVEQVVASRIHDLDPYARWLLRLASLRGIAFDARAVLRVAGTCDGPAVRDGFERLRDAHLVVDLTRELGRTTGSYRFTHEVIARVARSAWPPSHLSLGTKLLGADR